MRIHVDWFLCDGNGLCALEAPEFFSVDQNDELHLLSETFAEKDRERVERAVQACPKAALSISE